MNDKKKLFLFIYLFLLDYVKKDFLYLEKNFDKMIFLIHLKKDNNEQSL